MKRFFILIAISITFLFGSAGSFVMAEGSAGETYGETYGEAYSEAYEKQAATTETKTIETPSADPNSPADANSPADPNARRMRMRSFLGLEEAIEKLEPQNQAEIREWMTGEAERKRTLIDVIRERRQAEYSLLKKLALEEGAEKTAAAIDELIAKSNARYEHIVSRLDDEKRQARREQLREKREQKREERLRKREDRRGDRDRRTNRRTPSSSPSSSRRGEYGE